MFTLIGWFTKSSFWRRVLFGWLIVLHPKMRFGIFKVVGWIAAQFRFELNRNMLASFQGVFPAQTPRANERLLARFWQQGFQTLYELLIEMQGSGIPWYKIRCDGLEHLEATLRQGNGAIIYSPHMGNFFWAYAYLSERYACQTVVTASSKDLEPIYRSFGQRGYKGLDYDELPPLQLFQTLRRHLKNNGVVFLLGDFYRANFPQTELFGKPNCSPSGVVELSARCQSPVLPMCIYRDDSGDHRLKIEKPLEFLAETPIQNRLQLCVSWMEDEIRKHPEQWLYWFQLEQRWRENGQIDKVGERSEWNVARHIQTT